MKIVFFGSDVFSIKALEACLHSGMEPVRVVTTPPQKKGRGLRLESSEVFDYCQKKNIPVIEYASLREPKVGQELLALRPDIFVVASYGKIIPKELLEIPKYRLNVHPSLLPKYRGAAPIHWPILNGDKETGVSIIDIAEKLDAGDIYFQEKIPIGSRINSAELASELARFSYGVLKKVLEQVRDGQLRGMPQNEAEATIARQLSKRDGELSFAGMTAEVIDRRVRGLQPWPGAYCFMKGERIALLESDIPVTPAATEDEEPQKIVSAVPGTILEITKQDGVRIAVKEGVLEMLRVKPEGKKAMTAADFVRGRRFQAGDLVTG